LRRAKPNAWFRSLRRSLAYRKRFLVSLPAPAHQQAFSGRRLAKNENGTKEGSIQRVHGGEVPASPALTPVLERQFRDHANKQIVAKKAAQLVQNGAVIFLDSGTTAVEVAADLDPEKEFTVITHSPRAALVLAEQII
jgi:DeoR C terminal sensor domain